MLGAAPLTAQSCLEDRELGRAEYERGADTNGAPQLRAAPIFFLALFILSLVLAWRWYRDDTPAQEPDAAPRVVSARGALADDERTTVQIFKQSSPSVVHITNYQLLNRRGVLRLDPLAIQKGTGTGFLWDDGGYIVTNFHVVQGGQRWRVTFADNTVAEATFVGGSPSNDLAVLKLKDSTRSPPKLPIGTSHDLQVGQRVFAIGNPFGLDQTLTTGVISGLDRQIDGPNGVPIEDVIQTDAAINPGNSGGPLLDSAGRLIGVNTAIVSPSGAYAGIGFAIPVDTVNEVVPQLIRRPAARPSLGVVIWSDAQARRWGERGAIIRALAPGGPAARAGLRPSEDTARGVYLGDIIVQLGQHSINTRRDLAQALSRFDAGDAVEVRVRRDGQTRAVQITLGKARER